MPPFPAVAVRDDVTTDTLGQAIAGLNEPVVFKGLVRPWPIVQAALQSSDALIDYLLALDNGKPALAFRQQAGDGKFFYGEGLDGYNFQSARVPLAHALERLRALKGQGDNEHIYIQSALLKDYLPGVKRDNVLPGIGAEPRIWIGNASITQIHFDQHENLVCMVGGAKRFILFPPDQLPNMYIGPFGMTVAGVPTSMADLENPDFTAHPRFAEALKVATVADLGPGDVLYIPYMWWHHVVSIDDFNVQINYWWDPPQGSGKPQEALMHAILAVRDLPDDKKAVWKIMFDYFVFGCNGPVADHLPADKRGLMGDLSPEQRTAIRRQLGRSMGEN
ncbi:MAG: cupin-like domain-containing protein [Asticcacaulis sp.]|nr:cupin-like domain-containing protein [Asticcacaulis sp.]